MTTAGAPASERGRSVMAGPASAGTGAERAEEPLPGASRLGSEGARFLGHAHLWVLLDGTPAHLAPGRLAANEDGQLACHLCGRWFAHLGAHLRRHGWTVGQYREAAGLELHVLREGDRKKLADLARLPSVPPGWRG
jgi:hypothetical protein